MGLPESEDPPACVFPADFSLPGGESSEALHSQRSFGSSILSAVHRGRSAELQPFQEIQGKYDSFEIFLS